MLEPFFFKQPIGASYQISIYLAKQELPMAAVLVVWSARNMEILYRISYTTFLQSNNSLCLLVSEEIFFNFSQSEQELLMTTMFVVQWNEEIWYMIFHRCFLYNFALFGQMVLEEKIFRNWPAETRIAYGGHVY